VKCYSGLNFFESTSQQLNVQFAICGQETPTTAAWPAVCSSCAAARRAAANQSINQSCIFRVVQVIKSVQDPLEMGNNLPGINDNVRERGPEQKCFYTLTEG